MIIFNIESKGNLNDKINLINQKLLPFKSRKSSILLQMFEDIKKLLNCFNDKAHSIKKEEIKDELIVETKEEMKEEQKEEQKDELIDETKEEKKDELIEKTKMILNI